MKVVNRLAYMVLGFLFMLVSSACVQKHVPTQAPTNLKEFMALPPAPDPARTNAWRNMTPESRSRVQIEFYKSAVAFGRLNTHQILTLAEIIETGKRKMGTASVEWSIAPELKAKLDAAFPTPEDKRKLALFDLPQVPSLASR